MNRKQFLILISFLVIAFSHSAFAQLVWPGDINNNGIVNGVDLLYLGIAFDAIGPQREEESTDWEGHPFPEPWTESFPNGLNYAYADCNGNGLVEEDDFDSAVEDNFGLTHGPLFSDGYANAQGEVSPRLRLEPQSTFAQEGDTVRIDLLLDDVASPVNNFYGMAIKLSYTNSLIEGDDGPDFDLTEDNWIEADNSTVLDLFVDNDGQGQAEFAVSRTNQQAIPVNPGVIGQISIVIEDIIVGLSDDTLRVQIDSILLIDANLEAIPVQPDTVDIVIYRKTKWPRKPIAIPLLDATIYPNPAEGRLIVNTPTPLKNLNIIDETGRPMPALIRQEDHNSYSIHCSGLPSGIYFLRGVWANEIIYHKIILLNN